MNSDKAERLQENLFLIAYIMWMLYGILHITLWWDFGSVSTVCEYIRKTAFVLLFVRFLFKKRYTRRDITGIFLLILACVLALHSVYNKQIIPVAIFACCAEGVDYKKILRVTLILQAGIMVATIVASQVGIIEDIVWNQWDVETASARLRHSLGYAYCGYPAHILFFMTLIWFCVRKRITVLDAILCVTLNYTIYKVTDSRTDFYLAVFAAVGIFIWNRPYQNRLVRAARNFMTKFGLVFAAILSIAVQLLFRQEISWMSALNVKLSNRLFLGFQAIQQYGFSLLGSKIRWFGQGSVRVDPSRAYNYVDNAFLKDTLSYGILFLIVFMVLSYFVGSWIARKETHVIGWAMLMTFAYAVLNAHLFELTFNVFALLPGMLYDPKEEQVSKSLPESMERLKLQKMHPRLRRGLRMAVLILILGYVALMQMSGVKYLVNYGLMHAWVISGALLALAVLCCDNSTGGEYSIRPDIENDAGTYTNSWLLGAVLLFFALAFVSDFFVAKKFRYSAFCVFVFGGIFVQAWKRMKEPEQLLQEFKWAYKLIFVAIIVGSALLQPMTLGNSYKGIFTNASYLGIAALIALVVFLSDCKENAGGIANGAGAIAAVYMIWLTQKPMIEISTIIVFLYWLCYIFWNGGKRRSLGRIGRQGEGHDADSSNKWVMYKIFYIIAAVAFGSAIVFGEYMILNRGMLIPSTEAIEGILTQGHEAGNCSPFEFFRSGAWINVFRTRVWLAKEYLSGMNMTGNRYLMEIAGKTRWPKNSIIMNLYRYGIPAGLVYIAGVVLYFWHAIRYEFRRKNFFPTGLAFVCLIIAMTEAIEMPFIQLGWIAAGFSLAWMLVKPKTERKNEDVKISGGF